MKSERDSSGNPFIARYIMKAVEVEPKNCIVCGICSSNCPTDALRVDKETRQWMITPELCISCGLCISQCPKECIHFNETDEKLMVYDIPELKPTKKKARRTVRE